MIRLPGRALIATAALVAGAACASAPRVSEYGNPVRLKAAPTAPDISTNDLMSRIYAFADDSMHGRRAGDASVMKGTAYIAKELTRIGLTPAGDSGFFQNFAVGDKRSRNVVAILKGSDSTLNNSYVVIASAVDHPGSGTVADHDSVHLYRMAARATTRDTLLHKKLDSLRKQRGIRGDTIANGADDATGPMALLEIAEALAAASPKPRRSIVFVWSGAEEAGRAGSQWFAKHSPVPRAQIVAAIDLAAIGRGRHADLGAVGGFDYLAMLSDPAQPKDLTTTIVQQNMLLMRPFRLDFHYNGTDRPNDASASVVARARESGYTQCGIPNVVLFSGPHPDYRTPTDEAQYIDYAHVAATTMFVKDLAVTIANAPTRPASIPGKSC